LKVLLRADASTRVGTGHAMRCLALAQALVDTGHTATLATANMLPALSHRFAAEGVEVVPIHDDPVGSNQDLHTTRDLAGARDAEWIVVDGYDFSSSYLTALTGPWRVMLVDDVGRSRVNVASILNANIYATERLYPKRDPSSQLLLGPRYAPLRREFRRATGGRTTRHVARHILVSLGGSDPDNVTQRVVRALASRGIGILRVVLGAGHPDSGAVKAAANAGVEVLQDVPSLLPLLGWADVVVGAGGTSTLEYAFAGVPAVLLTLADNQAAVAPGLQRAGVAVAIGQADDGMERRLVGAVDRLSADLSRRRSMSIAGQTLVDGRGADRVLTSMAPPIVLRAAANYDADVLFAWANEPGVREASFDKTPIGWDEHVAWLAARLRDPRSRIWVAEEGDSPLGVARFALDGKRATISVTVAPDRRRKRAGTRLITTAVQRLLDEERIVGIDAWVRPENAASVRAFEASGFRKRTPTVRPDGVPPEALLLSLEAAKRG
jgi:UDP-2,4-diacetamido-2,4,6-trideoxy-beta-L-altropyranose hydrolase